MKSAMGQHNVRTTGVGKERAKKLSTTRLPVRMDNLSSASGFFADGTTVMKFKTGPYVYEAMAFNITSSAAIAGDTTTVDGVHYVNTDKLSKYVSKVRLEIDGVEERVLDMDTLVLLNAWRGYDEVNGFFFLEFGGPGEFHDRMVEDAYNLGTANVDRLWVKFDLTSDFDGATMTINERSSYYLGRRPLDYVRTLKTYKDTVAATGQHEYNQIPVSADLARILIFGTGIADVEMWVDDQLLYRLTTQELLAMNQIYGRDYTQLGNCLALDFWRSGEVTKGLMALEQAPQVRRNARIELKLNMTATGELTYLVERVGLYQQQA